MKIIQDFKLNPIKELNRRKKQINNAEKRFTKSVVVKTNKIREKKKESFRDLSMKLSESKNKVLRT